MDDRLSLLGFVFAPLFLACSGEWAASGTPGWNSEGYVPRVGKSSSELHSDNLLTDAHALILPLSLMVQKDIMIVFT